MKANKYIAILFSSLLLTACDDMLTTHGEGGLVDDDQIAQTVEANPERLNASVVGIYAPLKQPDGYFGSGRADDCGYPACALGQDMNSADMVNAVSGYDWFSVALEWSDRDPSYANPTLRLGLFYKVIFAANEVINTVPQDTKTPELRWSRGQAEAMRAFAYLSLAPYFQFNYADHKSDPSLPRLGVGDAFNNPRVSLEELYNEQILPDLLQAVADFKAGDGFQRSNKGQVDLKTTYGFLARAYLYMEEWAKAAAYADSALTTLGGSENYDGMPYTYEEIQNNPQFCNANDHNWIWGLLIPQELAGSDYATWPSQLASFSAEGYVAFAGIYRSINKLLWDKISTTDVRRSWWLDENRYSPYLENMSWDGASGMDLVKLVIPDVKKEMTAYSNVKFCGKSGCGSAYNDGDWCMMRVEEMMLIKAEGLAKSNKEGEGKAVLAKLMAERDPEYKQTCLDFGNEIWLQRRIELWGEGFAMADVMRLKKNVVRVVAGKKTNVPEDYQFNIAYGDPWMLMRFVQGELDNNPACKQNTGGSQPKTGYGAGLVDGVTNL